MNISPKSRLLALKQYQVARLIIINVLWASSLIFALYYLGWVKGVLAYIIVMQALTHVKMRVGEMLYELKIEIMKRKMELK